MRHDALRAAIGLVHTPLQVKFARSAPLPDGVDLVLRIAAGEREAEQEALAATERSPDVIRAAATFFIQQVLFCPNADSYRVLGATSAASTGELRRNMALLLRWVHPDLDPAGERSMFAARVTRAWNDLKTPDRRSAYDATWRDPAEQRGSRRKRRRHRRSGGRKIAADERTGRSRASREPWLLRVLRWILIPLLRPQRRR
ncbi:MAG TPA: hypothetical protein VLX85_05645 [Stellaceae bacterium]|nr:hypothetical protein [Stellaceae bacterium]